MCHLLFTYDLAWRLAGAGVTVNAPHPGLVKSNLMGEQMFLLRWISNLIAQSPEKAAEAPVYLATSPEVAGVTGKFFKGHHTIEPDAYALDAVVQRRL